MNEGAYCDCEYFTMFLGKANIQKNIGWNGKNKILMYRWSNANKAAQ